MGVIKSARSLWKNICVNCGSEPAPRPKRVRYAIRFHQKSDGNQANYFIGRRRQRTIRYAHAKLSKATLAEPTEGVRGGRTLPSGVRTSRARKIIRGLKEGLTEEEQYAVADRVVGQLKERGDPWRLNDEAPAATPPSTSQHPIPTSSKQRPRLQPNV